MRTRSSSTILVELKIILLLLLSSFSFPPSLLSLLFIATVSNSRSDVEELQVMKSSIDEEAYSNQ